MLGPLRMPSDQGYGHHQVDTSVLWRRQNIEQDRHRQRSEGAACATLDDAGGDELHRGRRTRREYKAERRRWRSTV